MGTDPAPRSEQNHAPGAHKVAHFSVAANNLTRHHFGPEGAAANHHSSPEENPVVNHPDSSAEPTSLAEWTDFHVKVQRLPGAEREVFDLLWYEGLPQKEAATILGVTDRTIKNRWRSAKLLLQEMMR